MNPSINQSINHTLAQSIHIHQSFSAPHCVTTLSNQTPSNRIKHQVNASRHHSNQCIKRSIRQSINQSINHYVGCISLCNQTLTSLSRNRIEHQVNPSRHLSQSIHIHQSFSVTINPYPAIILCSLAASTSIAFSHHQFVNESINPLLCAAVLEARRTPLRLPL